MKAKWIYATSNGPDKPEDKALCFDNKEVGEVTLVKDWWETTFHCCEPNEYPDGARFRTRRAAMLYVTKHATVMWIGGRYKEQ